MNTREDEAFFMKKLDRAFASIDWINTYPQYALQNQGILRLDHGSIILDFEVIQPLRRRPFRFEKMRLTHADCKGLVQSAWTTHTQGSKAFKLQHKLFTVKKQFIDWNKKVFGKIEREIRSQKKIRSIKIGRNVISLTPLFC